MEDSRHPSSQEMENPIDPIELESEAWPPWKEAIQRFRREEFKHGDVLYDTWLYSAFGLPLIEPATMLGAECNDIKLKFLAQFVHFQKHLLEKHQMYLRRERTNEGKGYRIVLPANQSAMAYETGVEDIKKAYRQMASALMNVDQSQLTPDEARTRDEYVIRVSRMAGMINQRKVKLLPDAKE